MNSPGMSSLGTNSPFILKTFEIKVAETQTPLKKLWLNINLTLLEETETNINKMKKISGPFILQEIFKHVKLFLKGEDRNIRVVHKMQ